MYLAHIWYTYIGSLLCHYRHIVQRDTAHYAMMMFPLVFPLQATTLSHILISLLSQQSLLPSITYKHKYQIKLSINLNTRKQVNIQLTHKETI